MDEDDQATQRSRQRPRVRIYGGHHRYLWGGSENSALREENSVSNRAYTRVTSWLQLTTRASASTKSLRRSAKAARLRSREKS